MRKNLYSLIGIGLITGALLWGLVQASSVQTNQTPSITDDGTTITFSSVQGNDDDSVTLGVAAATWVATSNFQTITGDVSGNTVTTITSGTTGQTLTLLFIDNEVTISDNNAHTADTIDLGAAFLSADDTTLTLIYNGTSWYEKSRSVN